MKITRITAEMIAAARRILDIYDEKDAEYRSLVEQKVHLVERMKRIRYHHARAANFFAENVEDFEVRTIECDDLSVVHQVRAGRGDIVGIFNETRGAVTDFSRGLAARYWSQRLIASIE